MIRKRLLAVTLGLASLGGVAAATSLSGGGASSQAILKVPDYVHCFASGQGGAVTTKLIAKNPQNSTLVHTYCGVYYVTGL